MIERVMSYARANAEVHEIPRQANMYEFGEPLLDHTVVNGNIGVEQDLYGAVRAGSELFGIVKATVLNDDHSTTEKFVLTRFGNEDERAMIIGQISDQPLVVGRQKQAESGLVLSADVSRQHFEIRVIHNRLYIQDLNSKNGTTLILGRSMSKEAEQPHTESRFGLAAAWRRAAARKYEEPTPYTQPAANPFSKMSAWAPESAGIKEVVEMGRLSHNTLEPQIIEDNHAVDEKIRRKFEGSADKHILGLSMNADLIGDRARHAYNRLPPLNSEGSKLDRDVKGGLIQSTELMARSIFAVLQDVRYSGITKLPEVRDALQAAFDLPILPADTMPHHLDWEDEDEIVVQAQTIQEELHMLDRASIRPHLEPTIIHSLQRASHGLAVLLEKAARNDRTSNALRKKTKYIEGNMQSPQHYTNKLQAQLNTGGS